MRAGSNPGGVRTCVATACLMVSIASVAAAQPEQPVGGFVVDLRGSAAPYGQNEELAGPLGFNTFATPSRGVGFEAGAHAYVFRWSVVTFGVGASFHTSRGNSVPDPEFVGGPPLRTTFTAMSPQVSFNFGGRDGWSYLSGGLGTSRLTLRAADDDDPLPQRRANTLNYGGGARWFLSERLAFSLDLRFYAISPLPPMDEHPSSPRMTLVTVNIGASFR